MPDIEHGELDSTDHPSSNRGNHTIEGFNAVLNEAALAALAATDTSADRGRVVYQTGGDFPGWHISDGAGDFWQMITAAGGKMRQPLDFVADASDDQAYLNFPELEDGPVIRITPRVHAVPNDALPGHRIIYGEFDISNPDGTLDPVTKWGSNLGDFIDTADDAWGQASLQIEANGSMVGDDHTVELHLAGTGRDLTEYRVFTFQMNIEPGENNVDALMQFHTLTFANPTDTLAVLGSGEMQLYGIYTVQEFNIAALRQLNTAGSNYVEIVRVGGGDEIYIGNPSTKTNILGVLDIESPSTGAQYVLRLNAQGADGSFIDMYVRTSTPNGVVSAVSGSVCFVRNDGSSMVYVNQSAGGTGTTWTALA